jgi:FkbM family methyltransferase
MLACTHLSCGLIGCKCSTNMNIKILMRKARVAMTPRNWLLKTRLANGAVVCGKNRAGYGGRGIYIFRDALEPELQHLEKFLDPQGVFLDIGANTGIYTIKAAKFFTGKGGVVIALEPFPDVLATLYHNVLTNGFTNVRLRSFCAGECAQAVTFWMNFNRPASFSLVRRDEKALYLSTLVVPVDNMFAWEGLNRLDYLKIDAEGAEAQVLAGAKETISKYRPIIQVEVNINDAQIDLPNYSVFQAATGSANKVYIPNESLKIDVPTQLGWNKIN